MNRCSFKCKCMKKIQNIEVTTYTYDPKCLAKLVQDKNHLPQRIPKNNSCKHLNSLLGNNVSSSNVYQCILNKSVDSLSKNEKSKFEVNPVNVDQTNTILVESVPIERFKDKSNRNHTQKSERRKSF